MLSHFQDNWDNRRVPSMNISAEQTQASMQRLADLMKEKKPLTGVPRLCRMAHARR